jgi:hypothetical protein
MIRECLLRIRGVEERIKRGADYGGAMLSVVLGAVLNPFFLIGAFKEAVAASNQSERVKEEQGGSAEQLVERAVAQWNYLMLEFLPPLWHHVLDGLFPVRFQFYDRVRKQLEESGPGQKDVLVKRLARRLAVLAKFLQYPAGEGGKFTRGMIASAARQHLDQLSYSGFQPF